MGNEEGFVVEADGEIIGAIQYGEEDDPMYRHANVDVFLATSRHGRRRSRPRLRADLP